MAKNQAFACPNWWDSWLKYTHPQTSRKHSRNLLKKWSRERRQAQDWSSLACGFTNRSGRFRTQFCRVLSSFVDINYNFSWLICSYANLLCTLPQFNLFTDSRKPYVIMTPFSCCQETENGTSESNAYNCGMHIINIIMHVYDAIDNRWRNCI